MGINLKILFISLIIFILFLLYHTCQYSFIIRKSYFFYLNYDYNTIKKAIILGKATERMLEDDGIVILERKWNGFTISTDKIINANWSLKADGLFLIQIKELNKKQVRVKQEVFITKNEIILDSRFLEPVSYVDNYRWNMNFSRKGDKTFVSIFSDVKVSCIMIPINKIRNLIKSKAETIIENRMKDTEHKLNYILKDYDNKKIIISIP